jgi:hypothetical protein
MIRFSIIFLLLLSNNVYANFHDAYSATCNLITRKQTINNKEYGDSCGTGVVYDETDKSYLILTAGHVVDVPGMKVEVRFYHTGEESHLMYGKSIKAEYDESNHNKDLAIVELSKSQFKNYPKPKIVKLGDKNYKFKRKEKISSIGFPKCGWETAWLGKYTGHVNKNLIKFAPPPLKGRSGSAIFDSNFKNILGVITRNDGTAISIKKIHEFVSAEIPMAEIKPVIELPYKPTWGEHRPGWEERGVEFRRWLAPSVRVTRPGGGGGSGTICHYDGEWAYVISCGHLYPSGRGTVADLKRRPISKSIRVYYHNDKKLDPHKDYMAETLAYVWNGVYDVSLLRFKPDWEPWVNRIAPEKFKYEKSKYYHSCGCDGLRPVAHYSVKFVEERSRKGVTEILTVNNGPRGGRSGGGVFTDDHQLLMICSRGDGKYGYWSSLHQIHKFLKEENLTFVLREPAREIPIIDKNNPPGKYPEDYIPIPQLSTY